MDLSRVNAALEAASSQDPNLLKQGENALKDFNNDPAYLLALVEIYGKSQNDGVRLVATLQMKVAFDKHWKTTPEDNRKNIKNIVESCVTEESDGKIVSQISLFCARIIRKDGNGSWPELFQKLVQAMNDQGSATKRNFAALIMKELVKMMKSKRLPRDRKSFRELSSDLWPIGGQLYNSSLSSAMEGKEIGVNLKSAHYGLKILKAIVLNSSMDPSRCPNVKSLSKSCLTGVPNILKAYNNLLCGIEKDSLDKFLTTHLKIIARISNEYPTAHVEILRELLQFVGELIVNGRKTYDEVPDKVLVQCMKILKQYSIKASADNPDDDDESDEKVQTRKIIKEFFSEEVLIALVRHVILEFLMISKDDLEQWESDPEEYMNEEKCEIWNYDLRPCSEVLMLSLVHHFSDFLVPVLVNMISEVQNNFIPQIAENPQIILTVDAVFNAIGQTSYELFDSIDFSGWFSSTLLPLLRNPSTDKILKRRICWLCGQWVTVKFSNELRPVLYEAMISLMGDEDLVIRLEAAMCLKLAIDDYNFEPPYFENFQESAITALFNLLRDCEECDTKMRVLYIYTLILKRLRGKTIGNLGQQLTEYLPQLWEHAAEHYMLRGAIVCSLLELVLALASNSVALYNLVLPVCATAIDPHSPAFIYLSDDGLELWLAVIQTAPASTPDLMELLKVVPSIINTGSEHLKLLLQVLEGYLVLDFNGFVNFNCSDIMVSCDALFDDMGDECLGIIVKFMTSFLINAKAHQLAELPQSACCLLRRIVSFFNENPGPILKSNMYSLVSRVITDYPYIVEPLAKEVGLDLTMFVQNWCKDMDQITHHDRRKLSVLSHISLCIGNLADPAKVFVPIVCASLEVLSDLGIRREKLEDNMVFDDSERKELECKSKPSEPAELWIDIRRRKVQLTNRAYTENLIARVTEFIKMSPEMYNSIDENVRTQLENLITGKVEGWGTCEKDDLFTTSGGEKFSGDTWS